MGGVVKRQGFEGGWEQGSAVRGEEGEERGGGCAADCGRSAADADETGLVLRVHHYPPGTSKWNKIEHRLFCHSRRTGAARR